MANWSITNSTYSFLVVKLWTSQVKSDAITFARVVPPTESFEVFTHFRQHLLRVYIFSLHA